MTKKQIKKTTVDVKAGGSVQDLRGPKSRVLRVLEAIEAGIDFWEDFFVGMTAPYGTSVHGRMRLVGKHTAERDTARYAWEKEEARRIEVQRICETVARLKKDGFIKSAPDRTPPFIFTSSGKDRFYKLERKHDKDSEQQQLPTINYQSSRGPKLVIIAYDIPETERRMRDWIRSALEFLGLTAVQKSMWAGKVILPQEFVDDLVKMGIFKYVDIFEVTKGGTLKKVEKEQGNSSGRS